MRGSPAREPRTGPQPKGRLPHRGSPPGLPGRKCGGGGGEGAGGAADCPCLGLATLTDCLGSVSWKQRPRGFWVGGRW